MENKKIYINEIKILYNLCIFTFLYIIFNIFIYTLFPNLVSFRKYFFCAFIIAFFIVFFIKPFDSSYIDYSTFKDKIKNMLLILGVSIIFLLFGDYNLRREIFKFYLGFIIFAVLLLRETRDFSSSLNSRKSMKNSILIALSMLVLSLDAVFKRVAAVLFIILKSVNYILDFFLIKLFYILGIIFNALFGNVKFPKIAQSIMDKMYNSNSDSSKNNITANTGKGSGYLDIGIRILIISVIVYFVIKIIFKVRNRNVSNSHNGEVIEVESIREGSNRKIKRAVFNKNMSVNEKIRLIYLKFEMLTSKKGIFKLYFTATELTNAVQEKVHFGNGLKELREIYNKIKFSNIEADEQDEAVMKEAYRKIKKNM